MFRVSTTTLLAAACVAAGASAGSASSDGLRPITDSVYALGANNPDLHEHLLEGGYELAAIAIHRSPTPGRCEW